LPKDELLKQLERFAGEGHVKVSYASRKNTNHEQMQQA
jgi:hypothetical protein